MSQSLVPFMAAPYYSPNARQVAAALTPPPLSAPGSSLASSSTDLDAQTLSGWKNGSPTPWWSPDEASRALGSLESSLDDSSLLDDSDLDTVAYWAAATLASAQVACGLNPPHPLTTQAMALTAAAVAVAHASDSLSALQPFFAAAHALVLADGIPAVWAERLHWALRALAAAAAAAAPKASLPQPALGLAAALRAVAVSAAGSLAAASSLADLAPLGTQPAKAVKTLQYCAGSALWSSVLLADWDAFDADGALVPRLDRAASLATLRAVYTVAAGLRTFADALAANTADASPKGGPTDAEAQADAALGLMAAGIDALAVVATSSAQAVDADAGAQVVGAARELPALLDSLKEATLYPTSSTKMTGSSASRAFARALDAVISQSAVLALRADLAALDAPPSTLSFPPQLSSWANAVIPFDGPFWSLCPALAADPAQPSLYPIAWPGSTTTTAAAPAAAAPADDSDIDDDDDDSNNNNDNDSDIDDNDDANDDLDPAGSAPAIGINDITADIESPGTPAVAEPAVATSEPEPTPATPAAPAPTSAATPVGSEPSSELVHPVLTPLVFATYEGLFDGIVALTKAMIAEYKALKESVARSPLAKLRLDLSTALKKAARGVKALAVSGGSLDAMPDALAALNTGIGFLSDDLTELSNDLSVFDPESARHFALYVTAVARSFRALAQALLAVLSDGTEPIPDAASAAVVMAGQDAVSAMYGLLGPGRDLVLHIQAIAASRSASRSASASNAVSAVLVGSPSRSHTNAVQAALDPASNTASLLLAATSGSDSLVADPAHPAATAGSDAVAVPVSPYAAQMHTRIVSSIEQLARFLAARYKYVKELAAAVSHPVLSPRDMDKLSKSFKHISRTVHALWKELKDGELPAVPRLRGLMEQLLGSLEELRLAAMHLHGLTNVPESNVDALAAALARGSGLLFEHYAALYSPDTRPFDQAVSVAFNVIANVANAACQLLEPPSPDSLPFVVYPVIDVDATFANPHIQPFSYMCGFSALGSADAADPADPAAAAAAGLSPVLVLAYSSFAGLADTCSTTLDMLRTAGSFSAQQSLCSQLAVILEPAQASLRALALTKGLDSPARVAAAVDVTNSAATLTRFLAFLVSEGMVSSESHTHAVLHDLKASLVNTTTRFASTVAVKPVDSASPADELAFEACPAAADAAGSDPAPAAAANNPADGPGTDASPTGKPAPADGSPGPAEASEDSRTAAAEAAGGSAPDQGSSPAAPQPRTRIASIAAVDAFVAAYSEAVSMATLEAFQADCRLAASLRLSDALQDAYTKSLPASLTAVDEAMAVVEDAISSDSPSGGTMPSPMVAGYLAFLAQVRRAVASLVDTGGNYVKVPHGMSMLSAEAETVHATVDKTVANIASPGTSSLTGDARQFMQAVKAAADSARAFVRAPQNKDRQRDHAAAIGAVSSSLTAVVSELTRVTLQAASQQNTPQDQFVEAYVGLGSAGASLGAMAKDINRRDSRVGGGPKSKTWSHRLCVTLHHVGKAARSASATAVDPSAVAQNLASVIQILESITAKFSRLLTKLLAVPVSGSLTDANNALAAVAANLASALDAFGTHAVAHANASDLGLGQDQVAHADAVRNLADTLTDAADAAAFLAWELDGGDARETPDDPAAGSESEIDDSPRRALSEIQLAPDAFAASPVIGPSYSDLYQAAMALLEYERSLAETGLSSSAVSALLEVAQSLKAIGRSHTVEDAQDTNSTRLANQVPVMLDVLRTLVREHADGPDADRSINTDALLQTIDDVEHAAARFTVSLNRVKGAGDDAAALDTHASDAAMFAEQIRRVVGSVTDLFYEGPGGGRTSSVRGGNTFEDLTHLSDLIATLRTAHATSGAVYSRNLAEIEEDMAPLLGALAAQADASASGQVDMDAIVGATRAWIELVRLATSHASVTARKLDAEDSAAAESEASKIRSLASKVVASVDDLSARLDSVVSTATGSGAGAWRELLYGANAVATHVAALLELAEDVDVDYGDDASVLVPSGTRRGSADAAQGDNPDAADSGSGGGCCCVLM